MGRVTRLVKCLGHCRREGRHAQSYCSSAPRMAARNTSSRCLSVARLAAKALNCRTISPSIDRKSTRLNSSHVSISYAVFCLKKKKVRVSDENVVTINTRFYTNCDKSVQSCHKRTLLTEPKVNRGTQVLCMSDSLAFGQYYCK